MCVDNTLKQKIKGKKQKISKKEKYNKFRFFFPLACPITIRDLHTYNVYMKI